MATIRGSVTVTATMADGTLVVEQTSDFGEFAGIVLGFRRDPDCVRLVWRVEPAPPPVVDGGADHLDRRIEEVYWRGQSRRGRRIAEQEVA